MTVRERIEEYMQTNDYVSFAELAQRFDTGGTMAIQLVPNVLVWADMSEEFSAAIQELLKEQKLFLHAASPLIYMIDGAMMQLRRAVSGCGQRSDRGAHLNRCAVPQPSPRFGF